MNGEISHNYKHKFYIKHLYRSENCILVAQYIFLSSIQCRMASMTVLDQKNATARIYAAEMLKTTRLTEEMALAFLTTCFSAMMSLIKAGAT